MATRMTRIFARSVRDVNGNTDDTDNTDLHGFLRVPRKGFTLGICAERAENPCKSV